jgi:methylmalonyl-CoA/ethylmalonyl-CoA epimerase
MLNKVEHIGIAVKDLEAAIQLYEKMLGVACYKVEHVESEGVRTAFFLKDGAKIELVAADREDSAIAKFIDKKGEGMHHIAYDVADIHLEMSRLVGEGFTLINEQPKKGADNKWVCFLHPKTTGSVLIELCQEIK